MNYKNSARTVLITGATGDIGRSIALEFAKAGWNMLCHYFSSENKAKQLIRAIRKYGVDCKAIKVDFSSSKQLRSFIRRLDGFHIDSVINNAGSYLANKHFSELTLDELSGTFMVNAFAPILLTASIFKGMKNRKFGRVVNISSIAAKYGGSNYSMHYGCSKLALEGLTKTLAKEGAKFNVLVNTVRPGVIDTAFHKKFPKDMKKRIALIPLKKMGSPKDIAGIVCYLGSEKNNFITNEIIAISGGE